MRLTREYMLDRMIARDSTFNGQFLTGVLSMGIYCLPSCAAREPNPENVTFFFAEEEARAAGLRPCRRCRPDDFYKDYDPHLEALTSLVAEVEHGPAAFASVTNMAQRSALGLSRLDALFRQHYHVTPATFLNRARLAAACRLLPERQSKPADVAFAVGYESLSAFHDNFRQQTGLSPGAYQRLGEEPQFTLSLPAGYLPTYTLRLWGRDANSPAERVEGNHISKAVRLGSTLALLHIELQPGSALCYVEAQNAAGPDEMRLAHTVASRLLGLGSDPLAFEQQLLEDERLAPLVEGRQGLRIAQAATPFEGLVWAIVGQQVNLSFAYTLRRALIQLAGEPVAGYRAHPSPEAVAALDYADLTARQFSRRKAEYLIDAARAMVSGTLPLNDLAYGSATEAEKRLLAVRGLGPWSVHYLMMRALGFADCVPVGDTGLTAALQRFFHLDERPNVARTRELMQPFAPFRSLATYHLWMTLGEPA
jgi:AraC family transcriptional regulator of adaptative response / DNA-3-methyladenine glycosylase II